MSEQIESERPGPSLRFAQICLLARRTGQRPIRHKEFVMKTMRKTTLLAHTLAIALALLTFASLAGAQASSSRLYATGNFGTELLDIDLTSHSVTVIGSTGQVQGFSLAFDPAGNAYTLVNLFLPSAQLATIDLNSGTASLRGQLLSSWLGYPQNLAIMGMVFTPEGTLLGGAMPPPSPTSIYKLDPTSGQPTLAGWRATAGELMSFAYDPTQGVLYAASPSALYTADPATGTATYVSTFSGNLGPIMGLAIDDNGAMYAADFTSSSKIYSVDRATGVATQLFDTGTSHVHNIAFNPGSPSVQLITLLARINALGLPGGIANSLSAKISSAFAAVNRSDNNTACNVIGAFSNEVDALAGNQVSQGASQEFVFRITRLRTALGCY